MPNGAPSVFTAASAPPLLLCEETALLPKGIAVLTAAGCVVPDSLTRVASAAVDPATLVAVSAPPPASNNDDDDDDDDSVAAVPPDVVCAVDSPPDALPLALSTVIVVAAAASSVAVTEAVPITSPSPAVMYVDSEASAAELAAFSAAASADEGMGVPLALQTLSRLLSGKLEVSSEGQLDWTQSMALVRKAGLAGEQMPGTRAGWVSCVCGGGTGWAKGMGVGERGWADGLTGYRVAGRAGVGVEALVVAEREAGDGAVLRAGEGGAGEEGEGEKKESGRQGGKRGHCGRGAGQGWRVWAAIVATFASDASERCLTSASYYIQRAMGGMMGREAAAFLSNERRWSRAAQMKQWEEARRKQDGPAPYLHRGRPAGRFRWGLNGGLNGGLNAGWIC